MRDNRLIAAGTAVLTLFAASAARSETLHDAMISAMKHYPPVMAEAARRDAARAGIDIARAGWLPRVTASGDVGAASGDRGLSAGSGNGALGTVGSPFGTDMATRWGYAVMAEQPVFDGFRTKSAVAEAQSGASAASEQTRVVEQLVLMETVTVFADLLRDLDIEKLRERDVAALGKHVASLRERAARGDAGLADVAQGRARYAQALAELITARANVSARNAEYKRVVGRPPGRLVRPSMPRSALPASLEAVIASAYENHPVAAAAGFKEEASRHAIERQRADALPQVKLRGGVEGDHAFSGVNGRNAASVSMRVTVPLYDGGETAARVEQARHVSRSLAEESRGVRDRLYAGATTAWTGLAAARERIEVERKAVAETEQAVAGLNEEVRLGQRSIVDLLDAQRDLVNAQIRVASSERELIVTSYALLSAAGTLTIAHLRAPPETKPTPSTTGVWSASTVVRPARTSKY